MGNTLTFKNIEVSKQEIIDRYFGKAISKTFTVFIIATIALFTASLTGAFASNKTTIQITGTVFNAFFCRFQKR